MRVDWTAQVDRALELLRDMSGGEAATRYGFGRHTITDWRRRRELGEEVVYMHRKNRAALTRLLGGHETSTIPVGLSARGRRVVSRADS